MADVGHFCSDPELLDPLTDKAADAGRWFQWPEEGTRCQTYYSYWMLLHKLYVAFSIVVRMAFEGKPDYSMVLAEFYLDAVFFVDVIRCFTQPYPEGTKVITDRRAIMRRYLRTWFVFDLYSFFPLALIRYHSKWEAGGKDE